MAHAQDTVSLYFANITSSSRMTSSEALFGSSFVVPPNVVKALLSAEKRSCSLFSFWLKGTKHERERRYHLDPIIAVVKPLISFSLQFPVSWSIYEAVVGNGQSVFLGCSALACVQ
jgi:hypothetical protein